MTNGEGEGKTKKKRKSKGERRRRNSLGGQRNDILSIWKNYTNKDNINNRKKRQRERKEGRRAKARRTKFVHGDDTAALGLGFEFGDLCHSPFLS